MRRYKNPRAFTLIELLLVMVILAVLAGVAMPIYFNYAQKSKISAAKTLLSNVEAQLQTYEVSHEGLPTTEEGIQALVNAGLFKKLPIDPWGNPLVYKCPGQVNTQLYDIYSMGPDSVDGTEDDIWPD